MDRRTFLSGFAASLAAGAVTGSPVWAAGESWKAEFAAAMAKRPWLLGFQSAAPGGYAERRMTVEGVLPAGLRGTLFRNGPARHEIGDMRYHHWFDGDGMVNAFRFEGGGATHIGRFVETAKFIDETAAGRALHPGFGTELPGMEPVRSADQINVANINVIWHGGELLALWEGGSAYRLDPETLETLGLKSWTAETRGLPFSAHPRVDADGTLWNFGYSTVAEALVIYRIDAGGVLRDQGVVRLPGIPMIHDFMITDRHLVFVLPPFRFDRAKQGDFLSRFNWSPDEGGRALIVDKNDLTTMQVVELPSFWVFHFSNAYDTGDGGIEFQAPVYRNPDAMTETFREVMRGNEVPAEGSTLITGRIDVAKATFSQTEIREGFASEFPRIDMRRAGQRHRHTVLMQSSAEAEGPIFDTVLRLDHETGDADRFRFAAGELAEEHIFVPDAGSADEGAGWVIGTALDSRTARTSLNVFDAGRIADGPVARLYADYPLPLGLHGNFVPA